MVTSSKYVLYGTVTCCAFCKQPFRSRNGELEFWRAANGEHFCSEFCADDAEEAQFRHRRAMAASAGAPARQHSRI
jgi:hypothetical protein